jgi:hypothetical protein
MTDAALGGANPTAAVSSHQDDGLHQVLQRCRRVLEVGPPVGQVRDGQPHRLHRDPADRVGQSERGIAAQRAGDGGDDPGSEVPAPSSSAPPTASPSPVRSARESATRVSRTPARTMTAAIAARTARLIPSGHGAPITAASHPAALGATPRRRPVAPSDLAQAVGE